MMLTARSVLTVCAILIVSFLSGSACYADTRTVTSNLDDGSPGTLREEIRLAQNGDTIVFDKALSGEQILLSTGSLIVDKGLTITAAGLPSKVIINGNRTGGGNFSVIRQTAGTLTVENLTITGSGPSAATIGGGINCSRGTDLNVINCLVVDNQAFRHGGISAWGNFTMSGTTVSGNSCTALTGVGGVDADGNNGTATLAISDCVISNNRGGDGGFDANFGIRGTVSNTIIDNNAALLPGTGTGGGYFYDVPDLTFENCTFNGNTGAGLKAWVRSRLTMNNCQISDNTTWGIQLQNSWLTMSDSRIMRNQGTQSAVQVRFTNVVTTTMTMSNTVIDGNAGIGIDHDAHQATLNDCLITNNQRGGIKNNGRILPEGRMTLNRCIVSGNTSSTANLPGGIWNLNAPMTLTECTVADNQALTGAGILNEAAPLTLADAVLTLNYCTVSGNVATNGDGGGIKAVNAPSMPTGPVPVTLNNCTVSGNVANGKGGGIYFNSAPVRSNLLLVASTVTQNSAAGAQSMGGGIFVAANPNSVATLNSTLVAVNTDGKNTNPDLSGAFITGNWNLIGIIDGSSGIDGPNDLVGDLTSPLDPVIDPILADNGGLTKTHAVLAGSPTIDNGDPAGQKTRDQRGVTRSATPTIGAYEYVAGGSPGGGRSQPYKGSVRKP